MVRRTCRGWRVFRVIGFSLVKLQGKDSFSANAEAALEEGVCR